MIVKQNKNITLNMLMNLIIYIVLTVVQVDIKLRMVNVYRKISLQ